MNTPTAIADAIRTLIKADNDAPRLILEALQEIPELEIVSREEFELQEEIVKRGMLRERQLRDEIRELESELEELKNR